MLRSLSVLVLSSLVVLTASGCAQRGAYVGRAAEPVIIKKAVRTFTLANGITLMVKDTQPPRPPPPPAKPGLSHFTEHMLFSGSLHLPPGRAEQYVESMGGLMTGHTGRDFSYIGATIPGKGWERALEIVFDLAAYPAFRPDEFEKQRGIIHLEINQRAREAETSLVEEFFGLSYRAHPYRFPITGRTAETAAYTRKDVAEYHARTFVPGNMAVVVVGDVEPGAVKAAVEKTFVQLPESKYARPKVPAEP